MSSARLVFVLALAGCESTEERIEAFKADADVDCWHYSCDDGPGALYPVLTIPTEQGVACLNDALASGARAMAAWSIYQFNPWGTRLRYVFTVDHEIKVFTGYAVANDEPEFTEWPTCTGPFRIGIDVCAARDPAHPGQFVSVQDIAWTGCP
jgi:hypothetical protein